MELKGSIGLKSVWQVAYVVKNIDEALKSFSRVLDMGPWKIWTYGSDTCTRIEVHGEETRTTWRVAISTASDPYVELIEPLEGPSIFREWLELHGEGIHHLGFRVDSLKESLRLMKEKGYSPILEGWGQGLKGDGGFAFFDLTDEFKTVIEFAEVPAEKEKPQSVFGGP